MIQYPIGMLMFFCFPTGWFNFNQIGDSVIQKQGQPKYVTMQFVNQVISGHVFTDSPVFLKIPEVIPPCGGPKDHRSKHIFTHFVEDKGLCHWQV